MTVKIWAGVVTAGVLAGILATSVFAGEPVFVKWLLMSDPGDRAIAEFWQRFEADDLDADGMVDLGTMLFYRGYPNDAIRVFKAALDVDDDLHEAWFRIGLVEHHRGEFRKARRAYSKCLKRFKGHGWCNFYMGLLEEQTGNAVKAMEYFDRAFRYAPVLADPAVNPEFGNSDLAYGARLEMMRRQAFSKNLPMDYLDPKSVAAARRPAGEKSAPEAESPPSDDVFTDIQAPASQEDPAAEAQPPAADRPDPNRRQPPEGRASRGARSPGESQPRPLEPAREVPPPAKAAPPSDLPYGLPGGVSVSGEASLDAWWHEVREAFV